MVSCKLVGRMANQAFTIAATIAYALKHGLEYHIPAHTLNDNVWKPIFTHLENANFNPSLRNIFLKETQHSYQELPTKIEQTTFLGDFPIDKEKVNIVIEGYRQSIKYFEDYLPEIRKAFGFDYKDYPYVLYGKSNSKLENICAIHVRRGDYLLYPTKHPVVTEEYLLQAIQIMCKKGVRNFAFFSDDISWCKEFVFNSTELGMQILKRENAFVYSENKAEIEDFKLMVNCKNFIISNSTFSLMAAILSESKDKICISPSKENWFGVDNGHLDTSTIIPDSFIQIKY